MIDRPIGYLGKAPPEQARALAELSTRPEWKVFREWLQAQSAELDRKALATANPHNCGAAVYARELLHLIDDAMDRYRDLRRQHLA